MTKVMVVDGPRVLHGVIQLLRQTPGITVVGEAQNASEALAIVEDRRPDVIIFDPRHIASDAAQFLRELATVAPWARIVVLTTYLTEPEQADLTRAGAGTIVFKEINSQALLQAIVPVSGPTNG